MEAHEGVLDIVVELTLDILVIDILGHGVVDIQQCHSILGNAGTDVLAQRAVDIHFAGHGDAAGGQTGIDIAGLKAEGFGESGPALVGKDNILSGALVLLSPVQQRQLELCHALQ